jgi:indolepyruvate ferredoxin oxidoreductase alpha subunit
LSRLPDGDVSSRNAGIRNPGGGCRFPAQESWHARAGRSTRKSLEIAYAGCMRLHAVSMKQVGLNVASDPFMSAAYMGVKGGFIVISADDPGPHSSQTEQDSRMWAMMAKVPVLDPASPAEAKEMVATAYALSEKFNTPVMLRPTTRVCHSRQDVALGLPATAGTEAKFDRDPARWAAMPKFRHKLHLELEEKLAGIAAYGPTAPVRLNPKARSRKAVVASGVAAAHTREIPPSWSLDEGRLYQVRSLPLHAALSSTCSMPTPISSCRRDHRRHRDAAGRPEARQQVIWLCPRVGSRHREDPDILGGFAGIRRPWPAGGAGRRPTFLRGCLTGQLSPSPRPAASTRATSAATWA